MGAGVERGSKVAHQNFNTEPVFWIGQKVIVRLKQVSHGAQSDYLNAYLQRGDSINGHGYECPDKHDTYSLSDGKEGVGEEVQTKGLMNIEVLDHAVRKKEQLGQLARPSWVMHPWPGVTPMSSASRYLGCLVSSHGTNYVTFSSLARRVSALQNLLLNTHLLHPLHAERVNMKTLNSAAEVTSA